MFHLNKKAVSLLEVLLVTVILVTLTAMSWPNLAKRHHAAVLEDFTQSLARLLEYGQLRAVMRQKNVVLVFEKTQKAFCLQEIGANEQRVSIPDRWGRLLTIPPGIQSAEVMSDIYSYPDGKVDKVVWEFRSLQNCFCLSTGIKRGAVVVESCGES